MEAKMSAIVVRNLPGETHRALKQRAAKNGRSTEAEIRSILEEAVRPAERLKIGSELAAFAKEIGDADLTFERDQTPVDAADFE
jgi:plasmid stability protein